MNRAAVPIILSALSLACFGQEVGQEDIDNHQAERQEWFYSQRQFPLGRIPTGARVNAIAAIRNLEIAARQQRPLGQATAHAADPNKWTLIGPRPTGGGTTNVTAGRVNAVAIDPRDNNTVYIGAAEGGVWKTTDGGANWTPLTDDQPSIANGAIALDPTNPDIVYVGTGEENFAQDSYYGAGILKSTDAGKTWTNIVGPFLRAVIGSMSIHPTNGQVILLTTSTGIWRSEDGAANWTRVLSGVGTFVLFDPTNGNVAYAALGNIGGSSLNGVYKSTDAGKTWSPSNGSGANAIPSQNVGRISIAIANSNTTTLFASIETAGTTADGQLMGIWKTTDGGQTWNRLPIPASLVSQWGGQVWYNNTIAVNPTDPSIVWAGGTPLFRSLDGGSTWAQVSQVGPNNVQIHVDQHLFVFTNDGSKLYLGNDGGVYSTTDAGASRVNFTDLNATLAVTQFYPGFSVHPSDPTIAIGGTQDNGTQRFSGNLSWNNVTCGDGGNTAIDFSVPSIAYSACQNIAINVTANNATSWLPAAYGINQADRTLFIAPLAMDPSNPQTLYFGTLRLWRSVDSSGKWAAVSPDLTGGGSRTGIKTIGVAPSDSNTVYVGTSDGLLRVTRNAFDPKGPTWSNTGTGLPVRAVTHIALDPIDPTIAYATFSGFAIGPDTLGHIFKTVNAGATWADVSGNLPNIPVNDLVVDPDIPGTFYAGTDAGVMISTDNAATWNTLGDSLPRVVVDSLVLQRATRTLLAATHGRSVWQIGVPLAGASSQPAITSLVPASATSGSGPFTIAVTGKNFGPNAKARWNGQILGTAFFDSTHLQVAIAPENVAAPGRATVTVFNPDPATGTSNAVPFSVGPAPVSSSNAAVSAAYPTGGSTLGLRSIASLYGTNLAGQTVVADALPPLPFSLGGTTVTIGPNTVPLFFVSPGQINFQVPFLAAGPYPLVIQQGLFSTTITVTLAQYAPAIFTMNSQGAGQAAALVNGTASIAAPVGAFTGSRPIQKGEYLSLYCTGLGDVRTRPALGSPSPSNPPTPTLTNPAVTLGNQPLDPAFVVFSGLAPGFVGLYQVNFQIPPTAPSGDAVPVTLAIGGSTSNTATIAIQ
jgi:uncharacterized protein (TIGR03437 family)